MGEQHDNLKSLALPKDFTIELCQIGIQSYYIWLAI